MCIGLIGIYPSTGSTARSPVQLPQFFLGFLENFPLPGGKLLSRAVDVEVEHGHGRAKSRALTVTAHVGGALEREGNPPRVIPGEYALIQIERIAGLGDLLRPPFGVTRGYGFSSVF